MRKCNSAIVKYILSAKYAEYILAGASLRQTGAKFKVNHSTVYRMIHRYLPRFNPKLYAEFVEEMKSRANVSEEPDHGV